MTSFTYRMPAGIPGAVTRVEHATIEPGLYSSGAPFSAFGLPAKISGGAYVPFSGGEAASALAALVVRPFPATVGSNSDGLGAGTRRRPAASEVS